MRRWFALMLGAALLVAGVGAAPASADTIAGGADAASATSIAPGIHTDTFERGSSTGEEPAAGLTKFYKIRLEQGEQLRVSAAIRKPRQGPKGADGMVGLRLTMLTADGRRCGEQEADGTAMNNDVSATLTVTLAPPAVSSLVTEPCLKQAGEVVLALTRYGDMLRKQPMAVDVVALVAPAVDAKTWPAPVPKAVGLDVPTLTSTPVERAGGSSYAEATAVEDGRYLGSIKPGQSVVYKVHLDYGQRVGYRIDPVRNPFTGSVELLSELHNPAWEILDVSVSKKAAGLKDAVNLDHVGQESIGASSPVPVRFRNREVELPPQSGYWLPGDYYIVMYLDVPRQQTNVALLYRLSVQRFGATEPGPPLVRDEQGQTPESASPSGSAGPSASGSPTITAASPPPTDSPDGVRLPGWLTAAGVVALLGVVGVVIAAVRRKDPT